MGYLGKALVISSTILILQGVRTMRSYAWINNEVIPIATYDSSTKERIKSFIDLEIIKNTFEQRLALFLVIISIVISVISILSRYDVTIASSFIPISLIMGIEFCFTLVLLYVQNEYRQWIGSR